MLSEISHPAHFDTVLVNRFRILDVGFKGVEMSTVEALKRRASWGDYTKVERLFVDWSSIEYAKVRYISISTRNKRRYFRDNKYENNLYKKNYYIQQRMILMKS